jgi:ATP-binding cassette subfamily A (ABC1) protein 3
VALAYVGKSKIIFLDEPSSGFDSVSRRELWDMLKNYKAGKIVILTTHYMDEADFLGDRIGIMTRGTL